MIDDSVKEKMRRLLTDIQSGKFAKESVLENQAGGASFRAMRRREEDEHVERLGAELRALAAEGIIEEAPAGSPSGGETR